MDKRSAPKPETSVSKTTTAKTKEKESSSSDSSSSSSSSSGRGSLARKEAGHRRTRRNNSGSRSIKVGPEPVKVGIVDASWLLLPDLVKRRCTWITPYSEKVCVSFHDEEWGVPVHDDQKLFELLILSQALAELSWPTILNKRDIFRKIFESFDASSVAKFSEKKIASLKSSGSLLLSEQKFRAVVENAKQMLKIMEEFGSFSRYCWSFVNHKPIINGFRYARQVPTKTPKAETMSKDLMQRGFRCVGPTVIYSFMQAAGLVNDHLSSCFRYGECIRPKAKEMKTKMEGSVAICEVMDEACSLKA